jgi:hypothetical protein
MLSRYYRDFPEQMCQVASTVLGLFMGIGLQWMSVQRLSQAQTVAQVREGTSLIALQEQLWPTAALLILLAGIYMTVTAWGWSTPWIDVSLAALLCQGAVAGALINRRLKAIHTGVAATEAPVGAFSPGLKRQITDPVLRTAVQINAVAGLGVVFLMTCIGYLGHPFVKEAHWAFTARLLSMVR